MRWLVVQVLDVEYLPAPHVLMTVKALQELVALPDNHPHVLAEGEGGGAHTATDSRQQAGRQDGMWVGGWVGDGCGAAV